MYIGYLYHISDRKVKKIDMIADIFKISKEDEIQLFSFTLVNTDLGHMVGKSYVVVEDGSKLTVKRRIRYKGSQEEKILILKEIADKMIERGEKINTITLKGKGFGNPVIKAYLDKYHKKK